MKLILGLLLLIISTFISYILSDKFKKRRVYYQNFRLFNSKLKNELVFTKKSIVELIDKKSCDDFMMNLNNYYQSGSEHSTFTFLKNDEIDFFYDYVKTIGNGDEVSQLEYVNAMDIEINKFLLEAEQNEKKYKTLYIKIGFLIGLILLIIIL